VRALYPTCLAALALACGSGDYPTGGADTPGPRGCGDDLDCSGDRICVDGACVAPLQTGGGDCIDAAASCGCEGKGFAEGLTYVAYKVCGGTESAEIVRRGDGASIAWNSAGERCSGDVDACEIGGLGRLLDQAFTGCPGAEPPNPCDVPGAVAYLMACREADGERCTLLPIGLDACGEGELLAGMQEVRERVRAAVETYCD
jgi:hypothetical protein